MYINKIKELNGCLRDSIPCKFLIGSFVKKSYDVSCSMGQETCRGYCCFHLDDTERGQSEEIQDLLLKEEDN